GDSLLLGGSYQTSAGNYSDTLSNSLGCDSVVNTVLAIYYSNTVTDTQTACDSLTWIDGVTYTASNNTANYTLTNSAGCDSVLTLDLTINYSNAGSSSVVACDSYTWAIDGNTYTASGTYNNVTTNVAGCTHTETLNLTINNSNSGTDTQTACDSYTWIDGVTYTSNNNTATHTLTNVAGCDSVVTLNLTINPIIANIVQNGNDIEASAINGTSPYFYDWSTGENTAIITPSANGLYWLVVTDSDSCFSDSATFDVTFVSGTGVKNWKNSMLIFPNPTNQNIAISIENFNGNIQTEVYDLLGNKLQTTNETTISLRDYARGIYLLKVAYGDRVDEVKVIKH
ncbi:T9SS type A sorting domain-containing protein, partial [bacterium]|nr:T9SS type A sorting domain-containing protein [bacterium]